MSKYDYEQGKIIVMNDYPFYALIQAAMRQADSDNIIKLKKAFPHVWLELEARYHAPNGDLPGDGKERIVIKEIID